jgi:hypothetical protein
MGVSEGGVMGAAMSEPYLGIRVECYAGYKGEETPRRFFVGERCVEVADVLDRWLAPDHSYFKVKGDDGAVYILQHDEVADSWELTRRCKNF